MSDFMPGASVRRPIPRKETRPFVGSSGVIYTQLSEWEHQLLREGKTDQIPTADQRGIPYPPPEPRPVKVVQERGRRRGERTTPDISKDSLRADITAGLSNRKMAAKYGVSDSTVSNWLKKHGLPIASERKGREE